jgi:hypothetical protein
VVRSRPAALLAGEARSIWFHSVRLRYDEGQPVRLEEFGDGREKLVEDLDVF